MSDAVCRHDGMPEDINEVMKQVLAEAIAEVDAEQAHEQPASSGNTVLDRLAAELTVVNGGWQAQLSPRNYKEMLFARTYASEYRHGTAGHNRLMLISYMADRLDIYERAIICLRENISGKVTAVSNEV